MNKFDLEILIDVKFNEAINKRVLKQQNQDYISELIKCKIIEEIENRNIKGDQQYNFISDEDIKIK